MTRRKSLAIYLLIFFLLSACVPTVGQNYGNWQAELAKNRAKWDSQHITHYRFQVAPPINSSYSSTPLVIEVKDGSPISVVDIKGITHTVNAGNAILQYYSDLLTIPDLFAYINDTYVGKPESMRVTYDPVLGYLTTIDVNPYAEPCCASFTITISDFHVLSP